MAVDGLGEPSPVGPSLQVFSWMDTYKPDKHRWTQTQLPQYGGEWWLGGDRCTFDPIGCQQPEGLTYLPWSLHISHCHLAYRSLCSLIKMVTVNM